jgi:hypothetical protein
MHPYEAAFSGGALVYRRLHLEEELRDNIQPVGNVVGFRYYGRLYLY